MEATVINFVETPEQAACTHRRRIEPFNGTTSDKRCRLCNLTRSFFNQAEDTRPGAQEEAPRLVRA